MKLAERMSRLGTETAFEVLAKARRLEAEGMDVIHLEIGEPDFDTPENIVDAGVKALQRGETHYGPSPGFPDVRATIAQEISQTRGISVSGDNVVITPGGKPIMFFIMLALVDYGDEVLYPNPGFPIYESMISFSGGVPVPMRLHESLDFNIDVDEVGEPDYRQNKADDCQLAQQPVRQRNGKGTARSTRRPRQGARHNRIVRRDLHPLPVRRYASQHCVIP